MDNLQFLFFLITNKQKTMKKIFSLMVACAAMFAFAACEEGSENTDKGNNDGGEKTALATPVLTVTDVTNTSFVVTWEAVENAVSYMVNDGEKNNTITETSFKMEKLNAGQYTVKVMAIPASDSNYSNSAWASISEIVTGLTPEEAASWVTYSVALPTEADAANHKYPFNSFFQTIKGTGIADIRYVVTTDMQSDASEVISDGYISDDKELEAANSDAGLVLPWSVNPETQYRAIAQVTNGDGLYVYFDKKITTEAAPAQHPELALWIGEWTASVKEVFSWEYTVTGEFDSEENKENDDKINTTSKTKDKSFKIRIEAMPDLAFNAVAIYGMTEVELVDAEDKVIEIPAFGQIDAYGFLNIVTGMQVGDLGGGYSAEWLCFCESAGQLVPVMGSYITHYLEIDENKNVTTYTMGGGTLTDGNEFTAYSMDVYGINRQSSQMVPLYNFDEEHLVFDVPAGPITMVPYVGTDDDTTGGNEDNTTEEPVAQSFSKGMNFKSFPVSKASAQSVVVKM